MKALAQFSLIVLFASFAVSSVAESPPVFLLQFGSPGTGDGQFLGPPGGLAADAAGDVFVTDPEDYRVEEFTGSGAFLGAWGSHGTGPGQFDIPDDVAIAPTGEIFVADGQNGRIEVFDSNFTFLRQWHTGTAATIAMNPTGTLLFVKSGGFFRVYRPDSTFVTSWTVPDNGLFDFAVGPSGNVYIGIMNDVRIYDTFGTEITRWSVPAPTMPGSAVAVDADEMVYVTTAEPSVKTFTSAGVLLSTFGSLGTGPGQFSTGPMSYITTDGQRSIFVADGPTHRVEKFGQGATPVARSSWGGLKLLYR